MNSVLKSNRLKKIEPPIHFSDVDKLFISTLDVELRVPKTDLRQRRNCKEVRDRTLKCDG